MSALIAAGIGAAGAIAASTLPKLMSGSGSSAGTTSGGGSTSQQTGPALGTPYLDFENQQLANINRLSTAPFKPYDVNSMFAPLNATQNAAFADVANAPSSWMGQSGAANGFLNQNYNPQYSPTGAAAGTFGQAGATPSALGTASPYLGMAGSTAPSNISSYLNPYIANTVGASDQLQSQNFTNNILPSLNAGFVASGGGLGSKANGSAVNMGLTNLNQNIGNTNAGIFSNAYSTAMSQEQADQARFAGLAGTAGNLALGQQQGYSNLGTSLGNNAALGANTNINTAGAFNQLGTSNLNNTLTGANALLQTGNQIQQNAQNPLTAAYQQFEQGIQWPYQTAQFAANTANAYTWPMATNTQSQNGGASTGTSTSSASPLGTGIGLAAGVASIPGLTQGIGNLIGYNPTNTSGGLSGVPGGPGIYANPAKRGGYFDDIVRRAPRGGFMGMDEVSSPAYQWNPGYWPQVRLARGGYAKHGQGNYGVGSIPHMPRSGVPGDPYFSADGGMRRGGYFAAGGYAPVVSSTRHMTALDIRAAKAKQAADARDAEGMTRRLAFARGGHFSAPAHSGYFAHV